MIDPADIKPAQTAAQCIDRLRSKNQSLREALIRLMYWMDKAREGQEIDLDKFNEVWSMCEELVQDD